MHNWEDRSVINRFFHLARLPAIYWSKAEISENSHLWMGATYILSAWWARMGVLWATALIRLFRGIFFFGVRRHGIFSVRFRRGREL